jgi:hypothetical protein
VSDEMKDDTSEPTKEPSSEGGDRDVVLLHGRTEDGEGVRAIRARERRLELAELRPLKKGKPLHAGEVVRLRPHKESPMICDVDVVYKADGEQGTSHAGPPNVSSARYRQNWDAIFGDLDEDKELN